MKPKEPWLTVHLEQRVIDDQGKEQLLCLSHRVHHVETSGAAELTVGIPVAQKAQQLIRLSHRGNGDGELQVYDTVETIENVYSPFFGRVFAPIGTLGVVVKIEPDTDLVHVQFGRPTMLYKRSQIRRIA